MGYTTYNSDGSPVQGWEEAVEGESELQRSRRRYQQRRCVACNTPERYGKKALCRLCWDAGQRYCAGCERLIGLEEWREQARVCAACKSAIEGRRRGWQPDGQRQAGLRTAAIIRERGRRRAAAAHALRNRGWSWAEIARHPDVAAPTAEAARTLHKRHYKGGKLRDDS